MPLYGTFIITYSGTFAGIPDLRALRYIHMIIFGMTFALPAALIPMYLYTRMIRNAAMKERRERIMPYYITLVFYLAAYLVIRAVPVSPVYQEFLLSACFTLFLVLVISFFWKISAHLAGLGGVTGLIVSLSVILKADLMFYLIILILSAGLTAYARLRVDAHNPQQVYSGFLLGFLTVMLVFFV